VATFLNLAVDPSLLATLNASSVPARLCNEPGSGPASRVCVCLFAVCTFPTSCQPRPVALVHASL
jgi:hypothetical protein